MKEQTLPLDASYDVIVVGGGPAGTTAATAAAREGAKTLLIEATGCLGGMGTAGLVPAWCPFSDKEKIIYRGLALKVFEALKSQMPHVKKNDMDWVPIDAEALKVIYDDMVQEAGVTVLFNTTLCSVDMGENDEVKALIFSNKAGLTAYSAKVYIDCSGDADLAAWAGAKFFKGDEKTNELQPATHCFVLSNVDDYAYQNGPSLHAGNPNSPIYDIINSKKYPSIPDLHLCSGLIGPSTYGFNAGHLWKIDNTDPASVSKGLMQGRKIAAEFRDALAEFFPKAFANSFLVSTGSLIGIRETRRIEGDYYLTFEDYKARRSFKDEICRNSYPIDIHYNKEDTEQWLAGQITDPMQSGYEKGDSHGIPYRCLLPKGIKNVLVAGRSISCDRTVQGSVRVMPVCLVMGEAAGIAAAIAINKNNNDVHKVDTALLRKRLIEEGGYLPDVK